MDERLRRAIVVPGLAVLFAVTAGLLARNAYQFANTSPEVGRRMGTGVRVEVLPVVAQPVTDVTGAPAEATPSEKLSARKARGGGSELAQRVREVLVEPGEFVEAEQPLVVFDTSALESRMDSDRGTLDSSDTRLQKLEEELDARRKEAKAALRTARASVTSARSTLERDRANLERTERLFGEGLVSRFDAENARHRRDLAEFNLRSAEENLLRVRNDNETLELALKSQMDTLRAELEQARANLQATEQDMANARFASPWEGQVIEVSATPGEWVAPGEMLVTLGKIDPIHVVARVAQEKVSEVFVGEQAEIHFDAFPYQAYSGEVVLIDPSVDRAQGTFKVTISVSNPDLRIRPGMTSFVRLVNKRQALAVHRSAVQGRGADARVYVVESGRAVERRVALGGALEGGHLEVLNGLREGDRAVTQAPGELRSGDPVRVVRR
jgi:membrane fusion protein (multidrug efflux system)